MTTRIERESELPIGVPFSLSCVDCDCDSPDSFTSAMLNGWTEIIEDLEGLGWNYIGYCPEHKP